MCSHSPSFSVTEGSPLTLHAHETSTTPEVPDHIESSVTLPFDLPRHHISLNTTSTGVPHHPRPSPGMKCVPTEHPVLPLSVPVRPTHKVSLPWHVRLHVSSRTG